MPRVSAALRRSVVALLLIGTSLWSAGAATTLYSEGWEGGLGGWSTMSGIGRACGGSFEGSCYMSLAPSCCSTIATATKGVGIALEGITTVSFYFRGSSTTGDTDSSFFVDLDSGETFVYGITGGRTNPNNEVYVNSQSAFASWGSANTWYRGSLVFHHAARQVHGELRTSGGASLGSGGNLGYSSSASQITGLRIDGVSWTGGTVAFRYDLVAVEMTATQPSAPQGLDAVGGSGQITLNWQEPLSDGGATVTSYKVYRGATPTSLSLVTEGGCANLGSWPSCADGGLGYSATRYYAVSAVNSAGEGLKGAVDAGTTLPFPSNADSTRCGFQPSLVPGRVFVLPAQWTFASTSPHVGWRSTGVPTQAAAQDLLNHRDAARLWYTAANLSQENYQAGELGELRNGGTATSAPVLVPDAPSTLYFSSRYDVEARDPRAKDQMLVEASADGGQSWAFLCKVNPTVSPQGTPDQSTCSDGTPAGAYPCPSDPAGSHTPQWEARSVPLPYLPGGYPLQLRLRFDTIDGIQNTGLGWMVTDVQIAP